MLYLLRYNVAKAPKHLNPQINQVRSFWEYVNKMFNVVDKERLKQFGPDRTCAEWILRNGGKVVFADGKMLGDYNALPSESQPVKQVLEIDASGSGISHYGFEHLIGCNMLRKIILHNNTYIDDKALKGLSYRSDTLSHVQVSKCPSVTDNGVNELKALQKLTTLVLFDLASVSNIEKCKHNLKQHLPNCKIKGGDEKKMNPINID